METPGGGGCGGGADVVLMICLCRCIIAGMHQFGVAERLGVRLLVSPPPLNRPNGGKPTLRATPEQRTKLSDTQGSWKNVQIPSATGSGIEASTAHTSPYWEAAHRRARREPTPKSELHLHVEYTRNSSKSTNSDASRVPLSSQALPTKSRPRDPRSNST